MTDEFSIDWSEIRQSFPVFEHQVYLNTGTFGPLLGSTLDRITEAARQEVTEGRASDAYYERLETLRRQTRSRLAQIINASPEEIALTTSTTAGAHVIVNGLGLHSDQEILTTDLEHHTFVTALRVSEAKVKVIAVAHLPAGQEVEALRNAANDATALIALSHVSWMDGRRLAVPAIAEIGPPVFVDGAQSVGAVTSDVVDLGCAFLTFPGQKWLLGPDATGGVFIQRSWHDRLKIALPSYYGHEPWQGQPTDIPLTNAVKFEPGPVALPMITAFDNALSFSSRWLPAGLERARRLTALLRERLCEDYEVITAPDQSTLLVFDPRVNADDACRRLAERHVIVRTVPPRNWLRVSVGYWNNEQDFDTLLTELRALQ